jgi:hypothetical protein
MSFAPHRGLLVLPLLLLLSLPARGRELEVEVGISLICDTQAQVERFVALYDGDAQSTVDTVLEANAPGRTLPSH